MKGKKLLAGFLSAMMLLGSMSFSVFADTLTVLPEAVDGIITIDSDADIDLGNAQIESPIVIAEGATNVTLKNGTIQPASVDAADYAITVEAYADVTLNGITVKGADADDKAAMGGVDFIFGKKIEINNTSISAGDTHLNASDGNVAWRKAPNVALNIHGKISSGADITSEVVGPVSITDSQISGGNMINEVTGVTSYDSSLFTDLDEAFGYFSCGDLTLTGSTVKGGNNDLATGGEALLVGHTANGATITIDNTTITGGEGGCRNTATNHGNGCDAVKMTQSLNDVKVKITNNSKLEGGKKSAAGQSTGYGFSTTSALAEVTVTDSTITAPEGGTAFAVQVLSDAELNVVLENATIGADNGNAFYPMWKGNTVKAEVKGNVTFVGDVSGNGNVALSGNGNVTVKETETDAPTSIVATVGGKYYTDFDSALAAAKDGETVTLMADAEVKKAMNITKNLTIDLGSHTLDSTAVADHHFNTPNITITIKGDKDNKGKLLFKDVTGNSFIWVMKPTVTLNLENIILEQVQGGHSMSNIIQSNDGPVNITGCEFKNMSADYGVVVGNHSAGKGGIVIKDTTINVTKGEALFGGNMVVENSTITAPTPIKMANDAHSITLTGTTVLNGINFEYWNNLGNVYVYGDNVKINLTEEPTKATKTSSFTVTAATGMITPYDKLDEALKAAVQGETVTMYADGEPTDLPKASNNAIYLTDASVLDLNGHTMTLGGFDYEISRSASGTSLTIQSGTEENPVEGGIIEVTTQVITGSGIFWLFPGQNMALKNITVNASNWSADTYAGYALINTNGGTGRIDIIDSTINVLPDEQVSLSNVIALNGSNWELNIHNSKMNVRNTNGFLIAHGNVTISGNNSEINADHTKYGLYLTFVEGQDSLTVKDAAKVIIKNVIGDDEHNPEAAGIQLGATTPYSKAATATVDAVISQGATAETSSSAVSLTLEPATSAEGEKVYDIRVNAKDDKTISRLASGQFVIELTSEKAFAYQVSGTNLVSVKRDSNNENKWLFNFGEENENKPDASGRTIKIGQIKVTGYGEFTLTVTDAELHAVTSDGKNIVTDFVKEPNADKTTEGPLTLPEAITDTVAKPVRDLVVNVLFNNNVTAQTAAYNDMTVTVSGHGLTKSIALGDVDAEGVVAIRDNKATVTFEGLLELSNEYMVEVSGAGYRTAACNVTMTEDKELTFWNNVIDAGAYIENGVGTAKKATFLAGELVKDGKINIYDLSAVVSYFGRTNDTTQVSNFAKYDLDRNGVIDSKDVAYVLASWNN